MTDDIFNVPKEKLPNLSDQELGYYRKVLTIPCPKPTDVDVTMEAYLYRISLWGPLTITHINPESKVNHKFTPENFLKYLDNQSLNAAYGLWTVEEVGIDRVRFFREYWGIDERNNVEEIFIDIKIKPSLLAPLRKERKI